MLRIGYRPRGNKSSADDVPPRGGSSITDCCKVIGLNLSTEDITKATQNLICDDMDRILKEEKIMPRKKVSEEIEDVDNNVILNSEIMSKRKADLDIKAEKIEDNKVMEEKLEMNTLKDDMVEFDEIKEEGKYKIHRDLCDNLHKLYVTKNEAYGDSVSDTYNKYGMISFIIRLTDKLNRASNLVTRNENKINDESLSDTLQDLANYALIALVELKNEQNKEE